MTHTDFIKKIRQKIPDHLMGITGSALVILLLFWIAFLVPEHISLRQEQSHLEEQQTELIEISRLSSRIRTLEESLTTEQKQAGKESMLKQVERLARDARVFNKISRLSPTQVSIENGTQAKGFVLEFNKISMATLAPFLENISYRSLLNVHEIEMRRTTDQEGILTTRITLLGETT